MKTIRVVAAIIRDGDRVLATQRGYGDFAGGWEFPGGKIEPGERPEEALVREIREELGAEVHVHELLTRVVYDYETFRLDMDCFLCDLPANEHVILLEHAAARWLDLAHLDDVDWLPADVQVVEALRTKFDQPHE